MIVSNFYSADEAINLREAPSADTYLNKVIAANRCESQAIHPGYSFLSENREFADIINSSRLMNIGLPFSLTDYSISISETRIT